MADDAFEQALRGGAGHPLPSLPGTTVVPPGAPQPKLADPEFEAALRATPPATQQHQGWGDWAWQGLKGLGERVVEGMASHEAHYPKRPEDVAGYDMHGTPLTAEGVAAWKKVGYSIYPHPPTLAERYKDVPSL